MQSIRLPKKIDHYTLTKFIARGGMGEVFLAVDDNLQREVAVKLLYIHNKDDERRLRFMTEARSIASLNHPNVVIIYSVGEYLQHSNGEIDSIPYIAMEFIDGEPLQNFIESRRLSLHDKVSIAIQIAEGLAAAHQRKIVHRDIKPSNVMVTYDGRIKILDFGLSKLILDSTPDASTQIKQTGEGTILGTIDYLSPEQAMGKKIDTRSDIFSLGIVLFQMFTGRHPYPGTNSVEVIAKIVTQEPIPWPENNTTPETLRKIILQCLRKDPDERFPSVEDLIDALEEFKTSLPPEPRKSRKINREMMEVVVADPLSNPSLAVCMTEELRRSTTTEQAQPESITIVRQDPPYWKMLAILSLVLLAVSSVYFWRSSLTPLPPPEKRPINNLQITSSSGLDFYPAFSPDGKWIAYSSDRNGSFEIYIKQLGTSGREIQVTSDGGQNFQPAWSPDGETLAYHSKAKGGVWIVPAFGGTVGRQLTEFGSTPAWSPDGKQLAFQSDGLIDLAANSFSALPPSTIWTISTQGSELKQITKQGTPGGGHGRPVWSPDGKWIVFSTYDRVTSDVWIVSLDGAQLNEIEHNIRYGYDPIFSPDGRFIYYCGIDNKSTYGIWKIPFSSESGKQTDKATEVASLGLGPIKQIAISADGKRLAYSAMTLTSNLWVQPLNKSGAPEGRPTPLTRDTGRNTRPVYSPDGKHLAFTRWKAGVNEDVWIMDPEGKNPLQITTDYEVDTNPDWFPDNSRIGFLSRRGGSQRYWLVNLKTGREEMIFDPQESIDFARLSPDGTRIAYNSRKAGETINLWVADIASKKTWQLTFDKELMGFPCWSPDSRIIAFEVKRGENIHLAVIPADGGDSKQLTRVAGQHWPYGWSSDNDRILFAGLRNGFWNIWWISVSTGKEMQLTKYENLNAYVRYPSWSPKGDRIIYEYVETTGNIWMIDNLEAPKP